MLKLIHSISFEGGVSFEVNVFGSKSWWLNDELHREDGPTVEWPDGTKYWYLNGKELTEEEFNAQVNS